MNYLPLAVCALGLLVALAAVAGRFIGPPEVHILAYTFSASSLLLVANTLLLLGIFLNLLSKK